MSASHAHPTKPTLRLVNPEGAALPRPMRGRYTGPLTAGTSALSGPWAEDGAEQVALENQSAAMGALDPRWILAVQVSREIQGGRAAIVTPESRGRLMLVGKRLGLRAFDSSLIIAIVQDTARCGLDPLGHSAVGRLHLIRGEPELVDARNGLTWAQVAAAVMAAGMFGAAVTLMAVKWLG